MNEKSKPKKILLKALKILGWIVFSMVLLLLTIALVIQLPPVQNKLVQQAVAFLEKKIGTDVSLDHISISFPKTIVLEGIYLEDQKQDTLLYAGRFAVDTDLWGLFRKEIELNEISLKNCRAYIHRPENDSAYNFSYILKAFAGDSTDTATVNSWKINVEEIEFRNIRSRYNDYLTGNHLELTLGELEVSISTFDLDKMKIVVDKINLSDTRTNVVQTKQPEVTEEVAEEKNPITYDIGVAEINLNNIHASFMQEALGQSIRLDLGEAFLQTDKIDLKQNRIDLNKFSFNNSFISIQKRQGESPAPEKQYDPEPETEKKAEESRPWVIALKELDMKENSFQFYDFTKPQTPGAVDFDHLWLTKLGIRAVDLLIRGTEIKAELKNLTFRERSGFAVNTMQAGLHVHQKGADISNLLLRTTNSVIRIDAHAAFSSLDRMATEYMDAKFNADIDQTSIAIRDLLYFNPNLKDSLSLDLPPNARINVDGKMHGSVANITIPHFTLRALENTYLNSRGTITGLPETAKLRMNIVLEKFYTTAKDIDTILPDSLLPASVSLPEWIDLHATYNGTLKASDFSAKLASSLGNITANGKFDIDSTSATRGYDAELDVNDFNLGKLLKKSPDTIGKIELHARLKTRGLSPEEMNGVIQADVRSFDYLNYHYENFRLDGRVVNGLYSLIARLKDENLDFRIDGDLNYRDAIPKYAITFDLKNVNFKELHLSERPLRARGTLEANLATKDFRSLNGTFGLRKVAIFNGEKLYAVDSLLFASIDQVGKSEIKIDSDLLSGSFEGSFNIFSIGNVIKQYFATYYSLHDPSAVAEKDPGHQYFKFHLKLKKSELFTGLLIPQLQSFVPGDIRGEFDSKLKQLDMRIDISDIQYANIGVRSFILSTNSDENRLNYNIFADRIMIDSMRIDGLEFNGTVANDSIHTNLIILDSLDRHKYVVGGIFKSLEKEYQLSLLQNEVMLNYVNWNVPSDNYLRFGGPKIIAKDINLVNGNQRIIIDSQDDAGPTLLIGFRELDLEYLVSMVAKQKTISGILHGDIHLVPDTANMTFTANIGIRNFNILEIPWGDITLDVDRNTANLFNVDFRVQSDRNNVQARGSYASGEKPEINMTASIYKFDLSSAEPLSMGQLKELKGQLTGEINIDGSPQKPRVEGELMLRSLSFFSTYLNTPFSLSRETIALTQKGIAFDDFQLLDNRKNRATIDGLIETTDYKTFAFNLDITTDNFRLLNTTEKDNELFYGRVDINTTMKMRGDLKEPVVNMQVSLGENSHLTYVVPQAEAGVMEQEGVVRFVDNTFRNDPFMKSINPADTVKSEFRGLNLTARIELSDKERFTVVIDPSTGDQLTVKGNTTLTLSIDPTGDIGLSGRYEISEGTYNLSFYKFVKREFQIEKGSTMTWSGDPLNAEMDISAIFEVETAPIDLLSAQLTGSDQQELNRYKQRLPFQVFLNISGELLKPEISFRLDMPLEHRNYGGGNVYSKIQDINSRESDLNKQVFALLLLKRFISDNPFENQGAAGLAGTARTSVSKMLTEQLNRLSQNVRGVELSFDVKSYEDYSSGQAQGQTQLQLGLSKNLFNDKLIVKVAGNVGIEGEDTNEEVTDYIGDLALEYKLTDDGRFRITGFRSSNFDMIDGELVETGAGLIYIKDYNLLSELFKANAKEKRKK